MPAAERLGGIRAAVAIVTPATASATFHGRDVFAPAAARLAHGARLTELGAPISDLVQLAFPKAMEDDGEVLHVDRYGNLITNIPGDRLSPNCTVVVGEHEVPVLAYYAAAEPNGLLALVGSAGWLEISVRDGNAAERTGAGRGTPVRLSRSLMAAIIPYPADWSKCLFRRPGGPRLPLRPVRRYCPGPQPGPSSGR